MPIKAKTKVKKLFENREKHFKDDTDAILDSMSTATAAIAKFIKKTDDVVIEGGELTWEDVTYIGGVEKDNEGYVIFIGVQSHQPGETFSLPNGQTVAITEETAEYFRRMIRVGLPFHLAVEGSAEEIVQFMEEAAKRDPYDPYDLDMMLESEPSTEFDLEELTDEQRESLMLHLKTSGYKI